MNSSSNPCDCYNEQHKEKHVNPKNIEDECIYEDCTKYKLQQTAR